MTCHTITPRTGAACASKTARVRHDSGASSAPHCSLGHVHVSRAQVHDDAVKMFQLTPSVLRVPDEHHAVSQDQDFTVPACVANVRTLACGDEATKQNYYFHRHTDDAGLAL